MLKTTLDVKSPFLTFLVAAQTTWGCLKHPQILILVGLTWHSHAIDIDLLDEAHQGHHGLHLCCGHVLPFPTGEKGRSCEGGFGLAPTTRTHGGVLELPESVPDSILEVDELLVVHHEEVAAVEEDIAFGQDVPQDLLLCLLGVTGVAMERGVLGDFDHQQPCLTFREAEEGWRLLNPCLGFFQGFLVASSPQDGGDQD